MAARAFSELLEIAHLFVRFDHVASVIVNANHGIVKEFALKRDLTLVCEPKRLALVNCEAKFDFASFEYLLRFWERISEAQMIAQLFN
jgi:hypothetical protein